MSSTLNTFLLNARFYWDRWAVELPMFTGRFLQPLTLARADLSRKNVIVTGGNAGLGFGIALQLASMNANVFLACRNANKAEAARSDILEKHPEASVRVLQLDTASFASVRQFAADWTHGPIDVLLHNAGIAAPAEGQPGFTDDGFEAMYQVNFLSSFLLTQLLEDRLAPDARVVLTSSLSSYNGNFLSDFSLERVVDRDESGFHSMHKQSLSSDRYFQTKFMQVVFAKLLQQHFDRDPTTQRLAFSWEPGLVVTDMKDHLGRFKYSEDPAWAVVSWFLRNTAIPVEQGVATGVHLAASDDKVLKHGKGQYWSRKAVRLTQADFYTQEQLERLWIRWSADAGISWT